MDRETRGMEARTEAFAEVLRKGEVKGAPPRGTVERWAWDHVTTTDLARKLAPPAPPRLWEEPPVPRRLLLPGRPAELVRAERAPKSGGKEALRSRRRRAQAFHTFLHHELQAAELMAFALLAFPEAPLAFKLGLLRVHHDEVRHMELYAEHLGSLGHRYGDFPVRDWFWERVPRAPTPAHFVAVMGVGFEGGNLDHAARFQDRLLAAGDPGGAALQARVGEEEIMHARFALRWFCRFTGKAEATFEDFAAHLPPPLTPTVMRGRPLARDARIRAGYTESFLDALEVWAP